MSKTIDASIGLTIAVFGAVRALTSFDFSRPAQSVAEMEWLSRLVPELAILIVAGIGARWLVKLFIDQLNVIQEREDARVERILSVWEENWKVYKSETNTLISKQAEERTEVYKHLSDGQDRITDNLRAITDILSRVARKLEAE